VGQPVEVRVFSTAPKEPGASRVFCFWAMVWMDYIQSRILMRDGFKPLSDFSSRFQPRFILGGCRQNLSCIFCREPANSRLTMATSCAAEGRHSITWPGSQSRSDVHPWRDRQNWQRKHGLVHQRVRRSWHLRHRYFEAGPWCRQRREFPGRHPCA